MGNEVGSASVAVVPTFKGFRTAVNKETDAAAKTGASGFARAFSSTGTSSGRQVGAGFKKAFDGESSGFASKAVRELESGVAKAASALSAARLKEQDAAGKVRLAERQLAEAREKYAGDTSQVIRAEERLATANRQLDSAQDGTKRSTNQLQDAQQNLARQADRTADQLGESGRKGARLFSSGFSDVFKGSFFGSALGNIASNLTSQIGYAIGAGLRKAVEFGIGTIDIASDLKESVNAVNVSYGPVAGAILDLGKTSAKTFAVSKRDLNNYAVQFSSFAKGIAGEGGDVAGTFQSILGRATDFASVMNLDVSEALQLFQSGLAGESEPLRRYGKDLSAANVEAYALANGIGDGTSELTEAQKQQARYGLLMASTADVQGDYARTAGEVANLNKSNAATWDDLQAAIGEGFLPLAATLASVLTTSVFPAISALVEEHGPSIGKMFEDIAPAIEDFVTDVLPKLPELFETVAEVTPLIIEGLSEVTPFLIDFVGKLVLGAQQIGDFFTGVGDGIAIFAEKMNIGEEQVLTFLGGIVDRFTLGGEQIGGFFSAVFGWFQGVSDRLALGQQQVFDFFGAVVARFQEGGEQLAGFFTAIGGWFQDVANRLAEGQSQFFNWAGSIGSAIGQGVAEFGRFAGEVGANIGRALSFVGELPGRAASALGDLGGILFRSGQSLIDGFIEGIRSMIGSVGDAVGGVVEWAAGFFPNSPAKRGPLSGAGWTSIRESGGALMDQWTSGMARSSITMPLSASLSASTEEATLAASRGRASASSTYSGPSELVIVDVNGHLIGRMQVEATSVMKDVMSPFSGGRR